MQSTSPTFKTDKVCVILHYCQNRTPVLSYSQEVRRMEELIPQIINLLEDLTEEELTFVWTILMGYFS